MNRPHQPLSRVKGGVHAVSSEFSSASLFLVWRRLQLPNSKSKLSILNRPQSQARRLNCSATDTTTPLAIQTTSPEGLATFRASDAAPLRVRSAGCRICRADDRIFRRPTLNRSQSSFASAPATKQSSSPQLEPRFQPDAAGADVDTPERRATGSHAAGGGRRRSAFSSRRRRRHRRDSAEACLLSSCAAAIPVTTKSSSTAFPSTIPAELSTSAFFLWQEPDRLEFVRGAQSTLYGSDAMTSVVQVFTRTGSTPVPELRFGADGGNLGHGEWICFARRGARPLRLQPLRRPVQHHGPGPERRLFELAAGRECRREV